MKGFLIRLAIGMLGLWVAQAIVPGVTITGLGTLALAAFLLGLANAVVRPLLVILTLPITLLTLGLFLLVVNAAVLALVAAMLDAFTIAGFWSALFGSCVVSVVSWLASGWIGPSGRFEVLVIERRAD
ncbi:MAG: phage holin family protein [Myxococcota bacterium]